MVWTHDEKCGKITMHMRSYGWYISRCKAATVQKSLVQVGAFAYIFGERTHYTHNHRHMLLISRNKILTKVLISHVCCWLLIIATSFLFLDDVLPPN